MNLKQHIEKEKLQQIHNAWKYLKPWQRTQIYAKALWWSLPSIYELLEWHRERARARWAYRLYKVHWVK